MRDTEKAQSLEDSGNNDDGASFDGDTGDFAGLQALVGGTGTGRSFLTPPKETKVKKSLDDKIKKNIGDAKVAFWKVMKLLIPIAFVILGYLVIQVIAPVNKLESEVENLKERHNELKEEMKGNNDTCESSIDELEESIHELEKQVIKNENK